MAVWIAWAEGAGEAGTPIPEAGAGELRSSPACITRQNPSEPIQVPPWQSNESISWDPTQNRRSLHPVPILPGPRSGDSLHVNPKEWSRCSMTLTPMRRIVGLGLHMMSNPVPGKGEVRR